MAKINVTVEIRKIWSPLFISYLDKIFNENVDLMRILSYIFKYRKN